MAPFSSSSLISYFLLLSSSNLLVVAQNADNDQDDDFVCHMCASGDPDDAMLLANPDNLWYFSTILGENNPTCQRVYDFSKVNVTSPDVCGFIQTRAAYCGCPEFDGVPPANACGLCLDHIYGGSDDTSSSTPTPPTLPDFGPDHNGQTTCGDLHNYLLHLPESQCSSPLVEQIQRRNFICGCPFPAEAIQEDDNSNSTSLLPPPTECSLCPDYSLDMEFPNAIIPNFNVRGNVNPTCREFQIAASVVSNLPDGQCESGQEQAAGYCGCPGVEPENACTFCPSASTDADGNDSDTVVELEFPDRAIRDWLLDINDENDEFETDVDTCLDLQRYMPYMTEERCNDARGLNIRAKAFLCGCPGDHVQPFCELCPAESFLELDDDALDRPSDSGRNISCGNLQELVWGQGEAGCQALAFPIQVGRENCCSALPTSSPSTAMPMTTMMPTIMMTPTPTTKAPTMSTFPEDPMEEITDNKMTSEPTSAPSIAQEDDNDVSSAVPKKRPTSTTTGTLLVVLAVIIFQVVTTSFL